MIDHASRSLWLEQCHDLTPVRSALDGDAEADVVVVGGGMTGIWAAHYLQQADPGLSIAVVEREIVGFGASGRNGGWVSAGIAGSARRYARERGWPAVRAAVAATNAAVDEIGGVIDTEGVGCDFVKAGTLVVATTTPQLQRLQAWHAQAAADRVLSEGERLLDSTDVESFARVPGVLGGFFTPHCASVNPALLVRGLAAAVERRGVRIYEATEVHAVEPGRVATPHGEVRARVVLRATEAYTTQLPGQARTYLPLTSLMIATEPLPAEVWETIGAAPGLTIRDRRHLFFYARRTADDRLAIGGRGAPYAWRRPIDARNERNHEVRRRLIETLHNHFPATRQFEVTHHWGGSLAVPRDWSMSVQFDRVTGLGSAGGYSGHGLVAANIAGRTLADLVTGATSALTALPWVGHRSGRWEPEPMRYLASRAIVGVLRSADRREDTTDRPARRTTVVRPFLPPG
jgi:glycine/D-amino acid oxidase-like deaminating enzyme